jgi:hypothetical protein
MDGMNGWERMLEQQGQEIARLRAAVQKAKDKLDDVLDETLDSYVPGNLIGAQRDQQLAALDLNDCMDIPELVALVSELDAALVVAI